MSEESTPSVPAEEARAEDSRPRAIAHALPRSRSTNEPAPALQVEDRSGRAMFHSLADAFKQRGFPGETATLEWGEARALTFGGTVDDLSPIRRDGVPLGADTRYALARVPVGRGRCRRDHRAGVQAGDAGRSARPPTWSARSPPRRPSRGADGRDGHHGQPLAGRRDRERNPERLSRVARAWPVDRRERSAADGQRRPRLLVTTGLAPRGTVSQGHVRRAERRSAAGSPR